MCSQSLFKGVSKFGKSFKVIKIFSLFLGNTQTKTNQRWRHLSAKDKMSKHKNVKYFFDENNLGLKYTESLGNSENYSGIETFISFYLKNTFPFQNCTEVHLKAYLRLQSCKVESIKC